MDVLEQPVRNSLRYETYNSLVLYLQPESPIARDWAGLADFLGFPSVVILAIQSMRGVNLYADLVLGAWDASGRGSVRKLVLALSCIGRQDCLNFLRKDPALKDVDFDSLLETAKSLKENDDEKEEMFPSYSVGELNLLPSTPTLPYPQPTLAAPHVPHPQHPTQPQLISEASNQSQPHPPINSQLHSRPLADIEVCVRASLASSPDEERFPSTETESQPTDLTPSKRGVFISYYPDPKTLSEVHHLAEQLRVNNFEVKFASDREMMDWDWKARAVQTCYNIIIVCTPRHSQEYRRLSEQSSNPALAYGAEPSKLAADRRLIQDIFYTPGEDKRILCVSLDRDTANISHCIPLLFKGRPRHSYPSKIVDILFYLEDKPRYVAPTPVNKIEIKSKIINFPEALKQHQRRQNRQNSSGGASPSLGRDSPPAYSPPEYSSQCAMAPHPLHPSNHRRSAVAPHHTSNHHHYFNNDAHCVTRKTSPTKSSVAKRFSSIFGRRR